MAKRQLELNLNKGRVGGRRSGSGRKRIHSKGVAHRKRERVSTRTPMHINFKLKASLKNKFCLRLLKRAILNARRKGLFVVHYSLQSNHVHLIVEANDNKSLEVGMRSLTVTFSKGIARGKVQLERYHLHVLRTIRETRNAVLYVLFNEQRHKGSNIDGYSSLLYLSTAFKLIREFAIKKRLTLTIGKMDLEGDELSPGRSFLVNQALK